MIKTKLIESVKNGLVKKRNLVFVFHDVWAEATIGRTLDIFFFFKNFETKSKPGHKQLQLWDQETGPLPRQYFLPVKQLKIFNPEPCEKDKPGKCQRRQSPYPSKPHFLPKPNPSPLQSILYRAPSRAENSIFWQLLDWSEKKNKCTFGSGSTPKKARARVTKPLLAKRAALSSGTAPLALRNPHHIYHLQYFWNSKKFVLTCWPPQRLWWYQVLASLGEWKGFPLVQPPSPRCYVSTKFRNFGHPLPLPSLLPWLCNSLWWRWRQGSPFCHQVMIIIRWHRMTKEVFVNVVWSVTTMLPTMMSLMVMTRTWWCPQ